jgi:hypothetical protein
MKVKHQYTNHVLRGGENVMTAISRELRMPGMRTPTTFNYRTSERLYQHITEHFYNIIVYKG